MTVLLTHQPIDRQRVLDQVQSTRAGAVVLFLGTTREITGTRQTVSLDYECYEAMAKKTLDELEAEAGRRWPLVHVAIEHRLGKVAIGEISVAIAVSAVHREPAFDAGKWLIDRIKQVVPIWKKENWAGGTSQWVHPGVPTDET